MTDLTTPAIDRRPRARIAFRRRSFVVGLGLVGCLLASPLSADEPAMPDGEMSMTATTVEPTPVLAATPVALPSRQPLVTAASFPGRQWVFFPARQDARLEETWSVLNEQAGPVLVCRGEPHGYLRTTSLYKDFELGLEWRFPTDEQGNSGVLMFTSGEDRIWPTAVQVQLHDSKTGSVFGSGAAQVEPELEATDVQRPAQQWNAMVISCRSGVVHVAINGQDVGEVKVVTPHAGAIGLQSEGSEIHFRNLWIRDLQPAVQAADVGQPMSCVCPPNCLVPPIGQFPISPTYGDWRAYPASSGWNWSPMAPQPVVTYPTTRNSRNVAYGNPLVGGDPVLYSGRRPALARVAAGESEPGFGRSAVRGARGGRHRR